jgi:hypothetical protein
MYIYIYSIPEEAFLRLSQSDTETEPDGDSTMSESSEPPFIGPVHMCDISVFELLGN